MNKSDLVVVVDDDLFALRLISKQLQQLGFTNCKCMSEATEAVRYLGANSSEAKIVICDLQMPGMDGIELINAIAAQGFSGGLLLISGEDARLLRSAERLVEAVGLELVGALQKPVKLDALSMMLAAFSAPIKMAAAGQRPTSEQVKQALECDQLINYYQPKVSLQNGAIVGWEALVRWQHPSQGVLGPGSFLPEIDALNLHDALLLQVLSGSTGALELLRQQASKGNGFKVAVNLADANLRDAKLPEQIHDLVKKYGVSPKNLVLEVSECRGATEKNLSMSTLSRLALKGFPLSLDDFGAGGTTLSDLSDIVISELKFDRAFVSNLQNNLAQRNSISSCIKMAQTLSMTTVAEGVEELEEWQVLRELGCQVVQGFLVAKPMPIAAIDAWCEAWHKSLKNSSLFEKADSPT
jgi:EAL domain-containing protein (putative c-di-GMP-specific phosphodiesterase class I)